MLGRLALSVASPIALSLVVAACSDSVSPPEATPAPATDGGTTTPDAASPDAGPSGPFKALTVTVTDIDGPVAGRTVIFHNRDGGALDIQESDAQGKVSSTKGPITQVTIGSAATGGTPSLVTYQGLENGDTIVVTLPVPRVQSPNNGGLSVKLPGAFAGASSYRVELGTCSIDARMEGGDPSQFFGLSLGRCARTAGSYLATALDGTNVPVAFSFEKGVALAKDTLLTVPAWVAAASLAVEVKNPPAGTTVSAGAHALANGSYYWFDSTAGAPTTAVVPAGFAEEYVVGAVADNVAGNRLSVTRKVAAGGAVTIDFAGAVATLDDAKLVNLDAQSIDKGSWAAQWKAAASATPDVVVLGVTFPLAPGVLQWTLYGPADAGVLAFPVIPKEANTAVPDRNQAPTAGMIQAFDDLAAKDYAAIKKAGFRVTEVTFEGSVAMRALAK